MYIDADVDVDIDSDMDVSINCGLLYKGVWGSFKGAWG